MFNLLEEEVIGNKLSLLLLGELVKGVESTSEVTLVGLESLADLLDDRESLFVGDAGSKGEFSEVTTDTNTGGDDHLSFIFGKGRAVKLGSVHAGDVFGVLTVLVVLIDDLVEKGSEGGVGAVGTGVSTDAGVDVLATGEDAGLERDTSIVLLSVAGVPDFLVEGLGKSGVGVTLRELGEGDEILGVLQPGATVSDTLFGSRLGKFDTTVSVRVSATHLFVCRDKNLLYFKKLNNR